MSHDNTKSLNVVIGGINIPVKVTPSEEMEVEEVVEKINTKLKEIQMRYPGKDLAEALAMTLLAISFERETERKNYPDQEELKNDFDQVDELLEKLLK
ncbi:cell division protein ZapA [Membranihabitans maritimus]|uniref:cell division protein ZapA n=1 Tax=Membranihabitans maritimus TaxID=2904244 RepID=UPI001F1AD6C4|nr:cell division protein ZapA [Membranihabitans maritimus]